jgi:hypothetical protein
MYCYEIQIRGRAVAIKKMLGAQVLNDFLDPLSNSIYGKTFRLEYEVRTSTPYPDWQGIDQMTVEHMADSAQEAEFDRAFQEREDCSVDEGAFICWPEAADKKPKRLRTTRRAYR